MYDDNFKIWRHFFKIWIVDNFLKVMKGNSFNIFGGEQFKLLYNDFDPVYVIYTSFGLYLKI